METEDESPSRAVTEARNTVLVTIALLVICVGGFFLIPQIPKIFLWLIIVTCSAGIVFYSWVLVAGTPVKMKERLNYQEYLQITIQCLVFLVSMFSDIHDYDTLILGNAMIAPPVVLAGVLKSMRSWMCVVALHFIASATCLCLRMYFIGGPSKNLALQLLLLLAILDAILVDVAKTKIESAKLHQEVECAHERLKNMSKTTVNKLFASFCDAEVQLDPEGTISEPSSRFAALLGTSGQAAQGQLFSRFVCKDDVEAFEEYYKDVLEEKRSGVINENRHAFSVRLRDPYGQPVPVHLFSTTLPLWQGSNFVTLGIVESWANKKKGKSAGPSEPLAAPSQEIGEAAAKSISSTPRCRPDSPSPLGRKQGLTEPLLTSERKSRDHFRSAEPIP